MKKSKAKFYESKDDSDLFKDVVYVIEATSFEYHTLWINYHYRPQPGSNFIKDWEQINPGYLVNIGELDNRPICVNVSFAKLNGKKVIFYDAVSQVVDHVIVDKWIKTYTDKIITKSGGRAHCDAMNFVHCFGEIEVQTVPK
jgi:hypothetical protein